MVSSNKTRAASYDPWTSNDANTRRIRNELIAYPQGRRMNHLIEATGLAESTARSKLFGMLLNGEIRIEKRNGVVVVFLEQGQPSE